MGNLLQDLRYAARTLRKNPGFAAIAILTLALGIGATTAIFSVVSGVLLSPLPYEEPGRLVRVHHANPAEGIEQEPFSPQNFEDLQRASASFEQLAAFWFAPGQSGMNLLAEGEPQRLEAAFVSADFFETLGVSATAGRPLLPAENVPGADRVVVLSDGLWRSRFGANPEVMGRTISLDGEPFTVVGVMPASFQFPSPEADIWTPISLIGEDDIPRLRGLRWMEVVGRLKPGVSLESASRETGAIMARLASEYPEANEGWTSARLLSLHEATVGDVRPALLVLFGAVGLVLLIACANLANLLLARTTTRSREIAVRTALGAGKGRLIRQLLTESLLLALMGGALGLVLAWWGVEVLVTLSAGSIPRPDEIGVDARVIGFTLVVSLGAAFVVGLIPALRASGTAPHSVLKEGGRAGSEGRQRHTARGVLVVIETALAVVLLIGAGLLIRSFLELTRVDPGFRSENVLTLSITTQSEKFSAPEERAAYRSEIFRRIEALPGVQAVGGSKTLPLRGGGEPFEFTLERRDGDIIAVRPEGGAFIVTPGYFRALEIPLLRGRTFTDRDDEDVPLVLMVNQAFARQYWPGENAIGKTLDLGDTSIEVVGVVGDVHTEGLTSAPVAAVYVPSSLAPRSTMKLFVRAIGDPAAMMEAVRRAIWDVDPTQPISDMTTMRQVIGEEVARPQFFTLLLGIFGGLALILASLGLYGVVSYTVGQRTHEIGIRMALGARRGDVLTTVIGRAMILVGLGLAVGLAGAFALTRLLSSLLYGVGATDSFTFVTVPLVLAAITLLAAYLPARRATRVDPMIALRAE